VLEAVIFDCDGVLADSERFGHLPAFNRAFAEFGMPLHWSEDEYGMRLAIAGGKERVASALTPEMISAAGLPDDTDALHDQIARLHARKTEIFTEIVASGALPGRPGIARIVDEATAEGVSVAVASTSTEASVRAILESTLGETRAARFAIFTGDIVPAKKPDPAIYTLALEQLGIDGSRAVAIEDSRNGLLAATNAGIACAVTVSSYTGEEDFSEAALVVSNLGDPGSPIDVLRSADAAPHREYVTLADLRAVVSASPGD
jgi:HAD superfamily hydrolase (TIGR01509 family)